MQRTTLILEDGCMKSIREIASREGRPISAVVNEILAEGIQRRMAGGARKPFAFPTFQMGRPRTNLADRDALEAAMEG